MKHLAPNHQNDSKGNTVVVTSIATLLQLSIATVLSLPTPKQALKLTTASSICLK